MKIDYDKIAFIGCSIDDFQNGNASYTRYPVSFVPSPPYSDFIPLGDRIIQAFTVDGFRYFKTLTGYFYKLENYPLVLPISKNIFDEMALLSSPVKSFLMLDKRYPRAGLTRGSNWSKLDTSGIQSLYKDGIK